MCKTVAQPIELIPLNKYLHIYVLSCYVSSVNYNLPSIINNKIFSFKLKADGKIITPGKLFKAFNLKRLNALFKKNIF